MALEAQIKARATTHLVVLQVAMISDVLEMVQNG